MRRHIRARFVKSVKLILVSSFLFFSIQCGDQQPPNELPPPDVNKEYISIDRVYHIQTGSRYPMSTDENKIVFSWKFFFNNNENAVVYLYASNKTTFLSTIAQKEITVVNGYSGQDELSWDGKMFFEGANRNIPLQPGNYYLRLTISTQEDWKKIEIQGNTWDSDYDDISDKVERENNGTDGPETPISYENNDYYYEQLSANSPPILPSNLLTSNDWYYNRSTHDYSLARGLVSNGSLENGLRITNSGTGYIYYAGPRPDQDCDPWDSDNWATLELINLVERVARKWDQLYNYPVITSGDMSRATGGLWEAHENCPGHDQHQNGLEVDIRYIRSDNSSAEVLITDEDHYSRTRTQQLVDLFLELATGAGVTILSSDDQLQGVWVVGRHTNHMHIWIADPDGNN